MSYVLVVAFIVEVVLGTVELFCEVFVGSLGHFRNQGVVDPNRIVDI